jgi:hypothetical protein
MSVTNPGREEQRAAEDDERAVDDLAGGHAPGAAHRQEATPCRAALGAHERGAEQRVGEQDRHGGQRADGLADLDEDVQLDERDDEEGQEEKGHPALRLARRAQREVKRGNGRARAERRARAGGTCERGGGGGG